MRDGFGFGPDSDHAQTGVFELPPIVLSGYVE